tara:strand:- start:507 stop:1205 length:699 start_codon:yes stop_codon:yes gene_type:complete
MKQKSQGFSLLEMVVAAAIITTTIGWSIPNYIQSVKQGEVDRYNRAIETGFQNLQENLRSTRTTCIFKLGSPNTWRSPDEILEFNSFAQLDVDGNPVLDTNDNPIIKIENPERLRCCNSQLKAQTNEECPTIEQIRQNQNTSQAAKSLRFMLQQNTPDSRKVEVAVDSSTFTMTPPGSNAETKPLTFMVRSINADENTKLKARCFRITGSGVLKRGSWIDSLQSGYCDFDER